MYVFVCVFFLFFSVMSLKYDMVLHQRNVKRTQFQHCYTMFYLYVYIKSIFQSINTKLSRNKSLHSATSSFLIKTQPPEGNLQNKLRQIVALYFNVCPRLHPVSYSARTYKSIWQLSGFLNIESENPFLVVSPSNINIIESDRHQSVENMGHISYFSPLIPLPQPHYGYSDRIAKSTVYFTIQLAEKVHTLWHENGKMSPVPLMKTILIRPPERKTENYDGERQPQQPCPATTNECRNASALE